VRGVDAGLVLAAVDDCSPTAVDERADDDLTVFFSTASARDAAAAAVGAALPAAIVTSRDVDDEDWARRSQENLTPITVGRITVTPPWSPPAGARSSSPSELTIVITPSMGFGTGHHATTRLCLTALQRLAVDGKSVLDVGTGSGVLAIAAALLGAREVLGIDIDADAIASARENLEANPAAALRVRLETVDVRSARFPAADIVLANLTGAALIQSAPLLRSCVAEGGSLIVSGLQTHERQAVIDAFVGAVSNWSGEDSDWVGLTFNFPVTSAV
jgi:ribosomal protein L11 methyltransferase